MDAPYARQWDPVPRHGESDYGVIGENSDGVWLRQHPDSLLLQHPELWDTVMEFRVGLRDITERDWAEKSNLEFNAKLIMTNALNRWTNRQLKEGSDGSAS